MLIFLHDELVIALATPLSLFELCSVIVVVSNQLNHLRSKAQTIQQRFRLGFSVLQFHPSANLCIAIRLES